MSSTKNVIGIDPSISCTGLVINENLFCIVNENLAHNKKQAFTKWFELSHVYADIITLSKPKHNIKPSFSESEIIKLHHYDILTNIIIDCIEKNIDDEKETTCIIEGFSYNAKAGHLIDLVTYSTLLRKKLLDKQYHVIVVPPASLKLHAAKMT